MITFSSSLEELQNKLERLSVKNSQTSLVLVAEAGAPLYG
jgi:hypothetical protein